MPTTLPSSITIEVHTGIVGGCRLLRAMFMSHSSASFWLLVSPEIRPSSSTPSSTTPPSRFNRADISLVTVVRMAVVPLELDPRVLLTGDEFEQSPFLFIGQNPYFRRRVSKASRPPSRISSTSSRTIRESIDPACPGATRARPPSASPAADSPRMSSASPRTGIFALCVEKMNCRRCFSSRMRGTTLSVMKRLSRSSSG